MATIILFQDFNFGGDALVLDASDPDLRPQDWNDQVSSLIVREGAWELFKDVQFQGTRWKVSSDGGPSGNGLYADPSDWNGTNDSISSLRPTTG